MSVWNGDEHSTFEFLTLMRDCRIHHPKSKIMLRSDRKHMDKKNTFGSLGGECIKGTQEQSYEKY